MNNDIKYSIIIPTLNEEAFIAKCLESTRNNIPNAEIIIADGGSADKTTDICKQYDVKILNSIKGRGRQLNEGAKTASGEILIFLHADTFLPDNAFNLIEDFFANPKNNICRFLLGFDFNNKMLDLYTAFSKYDTLFKRFGDSAIIVRNNFFNRLNGFEDSETFEDVNFFKRASKLSKVEILKDSVVSSSRRFIQNGVIYQQLLNIFLFIGYLLKIKIQTLSKMYNKKTSKSNTDSIIIFLRYPKNGQVKTRLAKTTSSEFATSFYKSCAENIVKNVKKIPGINRFAFYSNEDEKEKIIGWLGSKLFFSPQQGNDLGNRMKNAFEKIFSTGSQKVIIIGTDIPDLSKELIRDAFNSLDSNDVVIGPSEDGGYYLFGVKKMHTKLFDGIEYSTSSVLSETLARVKDLNLTYHLLPVLPDIDTEKDLIKWLNNNVVTSIKTEIKLAYKTA
jgi:rSAM/selenodomain-associated transferase 1/rSAM/selenodomain-associated transferase 2